MSLYDQELEEARQVVARSGADPEAFGFAMDYLPPDDTDGGGMFTQEYEVVVTAPSGRSQRYVGAIGRDWVAAFAHHLAEGAFR